MHLSSLSWSSLYLISEWSIRISMLLYVPQKRSPAAARAWLLLIFFLPLPGLALYGLMGRIYVPTKRIALQRYASTLIRAVQSRIPLPQGLKTAELPESLHGVVELATRLGDFGVLGGNRLELLPGYDVPLQRLLDDIEAARQSVHLLYYIFENDDVGLKFADALCDASRRGVKCRLLMDAVGSRSALTKLKPKLEAAGVEVHAMLPVGLFRRNVARFDLRNHRKIVVIDGTIAYTGSQNIVNAEFIRDCPNEELVVRIRGPVVSQMQSVFMGDWYFETDSVLSDPDLLPAQEIAGDTIAQVLPSGPGYARENIKDLMISLIYAAKFKLVLATPYFVPDGPFLEALLVAASRGVSVSLILPLRSNQRLTLLAQQSYYGQLSRAGIHVHLYHGHFLHAKFITADNNVAVIGSTNMDIRSFALNAEVSLLVYDEAVVARLHAIEDGYIAQSTDLSGARWSGRSKFRRVMQNLARMADSLL